MDERLEVEDNRLRELLMELKDPAREAGDSGEHGLDAAEKVEWVMGLRFGKGLALLRLALVERHDLNVWQCEDSVESIGDSRVINLGVVLEGLRMSAGSGAGGGMVTVA